MDFIEPVFGKRCIQFMNGEEAKLRRQNYDYYMNSEFVSMYFPSFVEVSACIHVWCKGVIHLDCNFGSDILCNTKSKLQQTVTT